MIANAPRGFSFVPQRTTGSRSDDRKFINTHLSRLAAERRKRGQPRVQTLTPTSTSRSSFEKFHQRQKQDQSVIRKDVSSKPESPTFSSSNPGAYSNDAIIKSADSSPADDTVSLPLQRESSHESLALDSPQPASTVSIPYSPSSIGHDPFQSTLIPIDGTTGALLRFSTDVFLPWVDGIERGQDKAAAYSNKFFQSTWDALQDRTTGYATLARLATMGSRVLHSPQAAMVAVEMKSKAYEDFRKQMSSPTAKPEAQMLTQMFSLLSMEVADRNLEASSMHATVLQKLVQKNDMATIAVDENLIQSILWHECMRGSFSLGRPVFDIERLADHDKLRACLTSVGNELYSLGLLPGGRSSGFYQCGLPRNVLDLVTEFRFMSDLSYALKQVPHMITAEVMSAYTFRATSISSNLLSLFNDAQDALSDAFPNSEHDLYRTGAVCLAVRFWYRCATSHELVDIENCQGIQMFQIYGTQQPILEKLREAFEYCQQTGTVQRYSRLWLWILYVGTLAERANIVLNRQSQTGSFFKQYFAALALSLKCYSWDAVEQILSTFLYSAEVGPLSGMLFEESMREFQTV